MLEWVCSFRHLARLFFSYFGFILNAVLLIYFKVFSPCCTQYFFLEPKAFQTAKFHFRSFDEGLGWTMRGTGCGWWIR